MAYNSSRKLKDNLQAIEIALNYHHGMPLTSGDIDNLRKYSGFGGIKAILYPNDTLESWVELGVSKEDLKMHEDIISLHRLLETRCSQADYKAIILSMKNSVLSAFYTPEVVPRMLFEALKDSSLVPRKVYEPSAGAGVFIHEAVSAFPHLELITAVEKDKMTGLILSAINSTIDIKHETHICGLEDTPARENGSYDLVVSNIPFGNFSVDDPEYPGKELSGKIHNYFFAKGIDKLADGGILAYITTDAFLNGPSNKEAREYLFQKSDFIGVAAMPDNLMSDTGNTQAPSHLLLVQKNDSKIALSPEEILLTSTDQQENVFGAFHKNTYLQQHPEVIIGSNIGAATNQYGQAHERIW
ncbi:N-6 DNA methylase, partial [Sphingobacterium multivorum]